MNDITDFFISLIEQCRSIDLARAEFERMMVDDTELRDAYREWCAREGHRPRSGFDEFCESYLADQSEIWDSLNDYDSHDF